jgi:broad specificity phosphatase PhoE
VTNGSPGRTLWAVRHGLRVDFVNQEWVSSAENRYNPPLHPKGLQQAEETAERLKSETIDHIFASPFLRTLQTASVVAKKIRKKIKVEAGFSEWLNPREFRDQPLLGEVIDLKREFPFIDTDYRSTTNPDYPEDREDLDVRTETALSRILNSHAGNVLIVSHGSPIQAIHKALTGVSPEAMPPMSSVTQFEFGSGEWKVVTSGDSSHLTTPDEIRRIFYSNQHSENDVDV